MARNDDLTTAEFLQPAAGPASLSGTISFGDASAELVGAIRSGAVVLDVADTEAWLARFDELAKVVETSEGSFGKPPAGWRRTNRSATSNYRGRSGPS